MSLRSTCTEAWRLLALLAWVLAAPVGAQTVEKVVMPGDVIEGHAKIEQECEKCHKRFDKAAQTGLCQDCHKDVAADVRAKKKLHGRLKDITCNKCHTDHKGRDAKIAPVDKKTFDHDTTGFRLRDAHQDLAARGEKCDSCHLPKRKYREAPSLCNDCHKKVDDEKGHKGHLGPKCENCHDEKSWKEARFDHEKTKFRLAGGKHAEVKCKECHPDVTYRQTPLTCNGCHKKIDQDKGHKGLYGVKCESCHNDRGWKEIDFDHDKDTKYLLKGKHRPVKCSACHPAEKGPLYQQKVSVKCVACHKKDDQDKGHRGGLGEKCESCHIEKGWKDTGFDHDETKFPLRDKHHKAKCEACHVGGVAGPKAKGKLQLDVACVSCHRKIDDEKGHKGRYGPKCEACHDEKAWKPAPRFAHDRDTKYRLLGKHRDTKCDDCHTVAQGNIYQKKLETKCIACHKKDDKHKNQLGDKCEDCHNEKKWQDAPYDHNKSRYALTGGHAKVECKKCHATPAYRDTPLTCNGCHEKDDKHKRRFGIKCETCHYTRTWKSWDFDHGKTRYPLDGAHRKVDCYGCHKERDPAPSKPGRACIACHAKDDVHEGGFSGQCERCHVTSDWKRVHK
ncbi:MAG: cytochrome C [Rhodocyclales bacterium]|nr:cytochrome C [Rhodocyclales bacterium]